MDVNHEPDFDRPKWNETRWFGCWNPHEGIGIYLHMGRFRHDLDMWWAQTAAYLPDGQVIVDRSFGRRPDKEGVRTGNFDLTMTEDGWTSTFDGAPELTTTEALARGPRGCAAPSVPVRWQITGTQAAPTWDMYGSVTETQSYAGDTHIQKTYRTTGTLRVADKEYRLDGVGFNDHSTGIRTWDNWFGHRFLVAVMPGWTAHAVEVHSPDGGRGKPFGVIFRDGHREEIDDFVLPPLTDPGGGPRHHELVLKTTTREPMILKTEILHSIPVTITESNDNINGIDWETTDTPIVLMESIARLTAPDGSVGYAFHERSACRDTLPRPTNSHPKPVV